MSSEVEDLERAKRKLPVLNSLVGVDESSAKKFKMDNVSMSEICVDIQDADVSVSSPPISTPSVSTPVSSLCSPVIVKKNPENLSQWLDMFSEWSNSNRLAALDALVTADICEVQQLRHLLSLIEPQLQRDFISLLPKELALHVLSYLSPQDLLNASQTCRAWRILCEDNLLWREKCEEEDLLGDADAFWGVEDKNAPRPAPSPVVTPKSFIITDDDEDNEEIQDFEEDIFEYSEYKLGYLRSKSVEFNWRNGVINYTPDEENLTPGNNNNNAQQAQPQQPAPAQNNASAKPQTAGPRKSIRELRKVRQLKGHEEHVITCLQFNPHKNLVVSGSDDHTLKVWSSETGKCIRTLVGHSGGVWSSQLGPDNIVISGSTDRTLRIWDAMTGKCLNVLYGHSSTVRCMALFGNTVVSGSRDSTIRIWAIKKEEGPTKESTIEAGQCRGVLVGHQASVRCVNYNGKICVSGAYDYLIKIWDAQKMQLLHTLDAHSNRVYSLQYDGKHIVSGSLDTTIRVWDAETGALKHTLIGHQSLTSGMQLRGNILVSGNADSTVKVWDINTGKCLRTLSGVNKHQSAVTCLQFNANFVITSSDDGTVKLWDLKTGEFIRNLISLPSGGSGGVVWRIRASNTKLVCAVGSRNGTEETKLLVLDFETPNMFFDNYSPEVRKTLKRLHPLSHPTPGRTMETLSTGYMPMLVKVQTQDTPMEVISAGDGGGGAKSSVHREPIAGASSAKLIECYLEPSEPNLAYIQVVDQNEDSLQHFQQQQEPTSSKNHRRKHEENKDSDNGSPAKKQARSDEVNTPDGQDAAILPGPSSSSNSSSSSTTNRQLPKTETVNDDSD